MELQGFGELESLFNTLGATAGPLGAQGATAQDTASRYWQSILGGRTAAQSAAAPEINSAINQASAQKKQLSQFGTSRGGGTAAASQTIDDKTRAQIDNLIAGQRGEAAKGLSQIGMADINAMLSALSEQGNVASNLTSLAGSSRQANLANQSSIGQGVGEIAMLALLA